MKRKADCHDQPNIFQKSQTIGLCNVYIGICLHIVRSLSTSCVDLRRGGIGRAEASNAEGREFESQLTETSNLQN